MFVTRIEAFDKSRRKIYVDEQLAFALYKGEVARYQIRENTELTQEIFDQIKSILIKRSRLRCMNLLKSMDRTEHQICEKLRQGGYPDEIIMQAVAYVKGYGYIDDKRYASSYIQCYRGKKSLLQIKQELMRRGISREDLETALSEQEPADEQVLIHKWIEKKRVDLQQVSPKEIQKLYMFLLRKGFVSEDISKALRRESDFQ